ncbi:GTP binding protein [Aureococcus anophagefferens]|nr:GTP binding protein [Aureococcus anophagefferens]
MGIVDKIKELEAEYARTQKNKATEGHLGIIKAKLSKLRSSLLEEQSSSGGGGDGFDVKKSGDGRVALIGFPSVGKSSLLSTLTSTQSEAAGYEFTTLTCIPGNILYNDTKIQLLDLPGIIEGAAHGKGRGKEVIAVARTSDLVLIVLDAGKEGVDDHKGILERELETVGLRLNKTPPNIALVKKATGGVKFNATVPLTKLGDDPAKTVNSILHEFRLHNCEVLFRGDYGTDELIDVINGNRKYVRCLYVYNKIDMIPLEDVEKLARQPDTIVMSVHLKLNLDYLLARMWDAMGLRHGITVEAATARISKELLVVFNYAEVWGTSTKHSPQRVGLSHVLQDEDVFQIIGQTNHQQKLDKNYSQRVQDYNRMIAEKRKTRTKEGKKKRSTG